jgi:hypothetical protein
LVVVVVDTGFLLGVLRWENRRRDRVDEGEGEGEGVRGEGRGLEDVTDLKNLSFRYVY